MPEQRTFIALTIPDHVIQRLGGLQTGLPDVRWTPPDQMHITLKFLGEVSDDSLEDLSSLLEEMRFTAPGIRIAGLGYFAQRKSPPVLWAGLEPEDPIQEIHRVIESSTGKLGFAKEKRNYRPHITLGRLRRSNPRRLQEYLELHHLFNTEDFFCQELVLFTSRLTPDGALHEPVVALDLSDA
ncbi:MAG: RNA 2',3'-cyclic phosphodiesterase [Leptospiraceae bacterium]